MTEPVPHALAGMVCEDRLASRVLGETRRLQVVLPPAYADSTASYPVLYLLDGQLLGDLVRGLLDYMRQLGQAPPVILVSLPVPDRLTWFTPRRSVVDADGTEQAAFASTGGGDTFLRFLEEELVPCIDRRYRTRTLNVGNAHGPPARLLAGYSISGLFCLYSAVEKPGLFDGIVAVDPSLWWSDAFVLKEAGQRPENLSRMPVYLCAGNTPENRSSRMPENAAAFYRLLQRQAGPGRHRYEYFEDEDHGTIAVTGFYRGLRFLYAPSQDETP